MIALAVLLLIAFVVVPVLRWRTTHYVITTHRLLFREGILARRGRDIGLSRITDVSYTQSLWERIINSGTLTIESAGDSGATVLNRSPTVTASSSCSTTWSRRTPTAGHRRTRTTSAGRASRAAARPGPPAGSDPLSVSPGRGADRSPLGGQLTRFAALGVDDPHLVRCAAVAPERDRSAVR